MNASEELSKPHAGKVGRFQPVLSEVHCRTDECEMELKAGGIHRWHWVRALACYVLLVLSACQAQSPRHTPEELASREAALKAVEVCDQIEEMYKRARCFHEAPVDYTEVDPDEIVGVTLTGIDHLADHLSVQDFSVDGAAGAQAGQGGSIMCCAKLPNRWREGLKVEVRWNVTNWRDCTGADYVRRVPVEPYHRPDSMYVHFLADGGVKVVSTPWYPEKANRPNSQYPIKDPIPDKAPWRKYPRDETCKKKEAVTRANKGTP